jgi:uncharacterized protein YhjY with autotransporter beta-barrel domain
MIAARMAFVETYRAQLRQAKGEPQWWISESNLGDYETRLAQKQKLLQAAPTRRPALTDQTARQLEATIGSARTESGLRLISDRSHSIAPAKNR